ncbi:MAG: class I SAM-dependent methyltransferase [Proteobacteria bacterium]|nr:class I SAM-dependent methyltransferase [Pseudomonadota bacterium]
MVASPDRHAEFFHRTLTAAVTENPKLRLMISGTADYAMLAHVVRAANSIVGEPEITVLDRCQTPLSLCSWYAERVGIDIETVARDILSYRSMKKFGVICTHSFLPQFPPDTRKKILARWSDLLVPGGQLITNVSIRQVSTKEPVGIANADTDRFCELIRQAAIYMPSVTADIDDLMAQARAYCTNRTSYSFQSEDEVVTLFEDSGYSIVELSSVEIGGAQDISGPGISRSSRYLELVATYNND